MEYVMVYSSTYRSTPPRTRARKGTQSQATSRFTGGMAAKIPALTDALGTSCTSNFCLAIASADGMIADKVPNPDAIIANDNERRARIVISQHQGVHGSCRSMEITTSAGT